MTDTSEDMTPDQADDMLAAEYVLGVLDLPQRLALEARLKTDISFAARVSAWEVHMGGLNGEFAETAAPMDLLPKIEARLFPVVPRPRRAWMAWLGGALAAGVVALVVGINLPQPAQIVAQLGAQGQGLVYLAAYSDGALEISRLAGNRPPAGQDHELWLIAPGAAPVSLGILGDTPLRVTYARPPVGWVLAVSVEPTGGSLTGAPTGPVILTAEISA